MHTFILATLILMNTPAVPTTDEAKPAPTLLVLDRRNEAILPPHFRKMNDPLPPGTNIKGLDTLRASGSAQFSELSLRVIWEALNMPKSFAVIDLRDESHGFINGAAVTWYATKDWGNRGLSSKEAEEDEKKKLEAIEIGSTIRIFEIKEKSPDGEIVKTSSEEVKVSSVTNEETVAKNNGARYLRLHVVDHEKPNWTEAELFLNYVRGLPKNAWIHVHCRGGKGRTTTFLCLYDIIQNGKNVPFDDIIKRQHLLGGIDLTRPSVEDGWKAPLVKERLAFLKDFYDRIVKDEI